MPSHDADRNLLFGVLALQLDLIDRGQFAEACAAWALDKKVPLADVLCGRGWVDPEDRADVESLMRRKLEKHDGDARVSLASMVTLRVDDGLAGVADFELHSVLTEAAAGDHAPLAAAATADRSAETRGHYPLVRLHAQGGLGRVWLARDPVLGREIALKELRPERAGDPWYRSRLLEEARITGQLDHPGIVTIHELACRHGGAGPFYTMRFVRGRTLTDAAREHHRKREACEVGPLELTELLNAFIAACNAVAYAHSRGVVHRDIKGQNLVMGDFGDVVVLDWGLAKLVGRPEPDRPTPAVVLDGRGDHGQTLPGQLLGTPGYMAPEQAEGRPDLIGPWTDIYGLGAVLYEVLTGVAPFGGSSAAEAVRRSIEEEAPSPRRICPAAPPALEAVCRRAMARTPGARYASATELAADVQRWLVDEPVSAYADPPSVRLGRWARRHRSAVTVGAALLVAALGVLGVSTVRVAREQARAATAYRAEAAERKRAESHYRVAREGVDRMYYDVLGDPLLGTPRMDPLRRKLVRAALDSYGGLAAVRPGDNDVRYHLACTLLRHSRAAREAGDRDEAVASGERSLAILADLRAREPGEVDYQSDLANGHLDLGQMYGDAGDTTRAEASIKEAAAIWGALAAGAGGAKYLKAQANAYDALGDCYQRARRLDRAASAHETAVKAREEFARVDPRAAGEAEFREATASCELNLATLAFRRKDWAGAEGHFRRAAGGFEALLGGQADERARTRLGYALQGLGKARDRRGDPKGAESDLERTREIWARLADEHPDIFEHRFNLATTLRLLGDVLNPADHKPGDPDGARRHYGKALEAWEAIRGDFPRDVGVDNARAKTWFGLGRCALAEGRAAEARTSLEAARQLWEALPAGSRAEYDADFRGDLRTLLDGIGPAGADAGA